MARRKVVERFSGATEDDALIVKFFDFVDQEGLPLDVVVSTLHSRVVDIHGPGGRRYTRLMPDWADFMTRARSSGWNMKRKMAELSTVVLDVYGPDWHAGWVRRMGAWVENSA